MFQNSKNIKIYGGNFTAVGGKSKDIWHDHIAPGAFHNSRERLEYDPPKCHPETRVAVIQAIMDWIKDGQKTTFIKWLNGAAGVGKSAIAQKIAELCHKSGRLAASFFWSRSAGGRNDQGRLIASLAYHLLTVIPQLRGPVEKAVELDAYIFTRSLETQMETLIIQSLREVFEHNQPGQVDSPMVIILDGLDECGTPEAQQYVLRLIAESVSKFPIPLCFLIASRPEKAIRDSFNNQPLLGITDRLVLDEKYHPDNDIRLFLVESLESVKRTHELRSLLPPVWPSNDDINRLVRKSSGQFIYAATVVKFVKSSRQRPNRQLDIILGVTAAASATPFAELDALYSTIFSLVLKEDLERALEIISVNMFLCNLTARQIETMLSYPHGELQRILVDLHSVLHVPALKSEDAETNEEGEETDKEGEDTDKGEETDGGEETDEEDLEPYEKQLRILHASLRDFLLDSYRSKDFHVDKGIACERIARHFLRYIREYSDGTEDPYESVIIIVSWLHSVMLEASPTAELLCDCFEFDPVKWASMLIKDIESNDSESAFNSYTKMVNLRNWFQAQEAYILEYLGPTRSLKAHHSRSWEFASDLICEYVCRALHEEHPKSGGNVATAITHPEILDISNNGEIFDWVFRVKFYLFFAPRVSSGMTAIQKYLRDQERARGYFVDGGMYASLSMHLLKVVLAFRRSSEDDHGKQKENDHKETSDSMALGFAILGLPFYLSNADYNPKLVELARSMLDQKMKEKLFQLHEDINIEHEEIEQLCEAIDIYLKKAPVTPNDAQPNESQAVAERFRADKRRRESDDDLEVTGAPALSSTLKRTKVMDVLSPTETDSKTGPDVFTLADYNISNAALDDLAFADGHGIDYLSSDILETDAYSPNETDSQTGLDLFTLGDYNISNAAFDDLAFADGHGIDYLSFDILDRFLETFGPPDGAF